MSATNEELSIGAASRTPMARFCERVDRHRKGLSTVLAVTAFAAALLGRSSWPAQTPAHEAIETLGFLLLALCVAGRVVSTIYIGGRKNGEIVRLGPYSVVRNPLYGCSVLGFAGLGLSVGSLAIGIASGAALFLLYSAVVRAEEARLLGHFGGSYRAYLDEVPRWIPDFSLWREAERTEVMPGLVQRTLWEGIGLLALALLIKALEQGQLFGLLPMLVNLP